MFRKLNAQASFLRRCRRYSEEREIARTTGHRSIAALRGYVERATVIDGDVVRRLALQGGTIVQIKST